tara:strand:- start:84 stop:1706 length:1623 start_codon:yes stop_codon:yes gene_type:complete
MIIFIADFFVEQVAGGGELANEEVIKTLRNNNFEVITKHSHEITAADLKKESDSFFIVANFVNLKKELLPLFNSLNYVIYEHDHKYLTTRDPSVFENYFAPYESIINKDFYKNAKAVLCQSKMHARVVAKNLLINNVVNLGCSLWDEKVLDHIESLVDNKKENKHSIVRSTNKIKGTFEAILYCRENELDYELIESPNYEEFLRQLSKNENLIFFPKTLETFCRLAVEARMLGVKLTTNKNIGATSEPFFELKGKESIDFIRNKQKEVYKVFFDLIENKKVKCITTPKIPKISIVSSVYDADQFIEGFLEDITRQTIFKNCELILVNANSPGNEEPVIKKYMNKYKNIIYKKLDHDPGVYGTWNVGIKAATGKFITNANVDDRRAPNQIEVLARELVNHPEVGLVYSQCFITSVSNEAYENNSSKNQVYAVKEYSRENMIKCLPGCMPLWRKSLHKKSGYFDEEYKHAGDWAMWLAFIENGQKFKKVPGVHGLYYHNPNGLSTSVDSFNTRYKEEKEVFFDHKNVFGTENFNRYKNYFTR